MAEVEEPITAAGCLEYVNDKVFPLRPAEYGQKFPQWPGLVGLEIEMLPLRKASLHQPKPATVPLYGADSISSCLFALRSSQPKWRYQTVPEEPDHLLNVLLEDEDQISFEPGGQLEISTKPYPCLLDATRRLREVQGWIDSALAEAGIQITQIGMNPWLNVDEIGLQMTKPRYRAMDGFFTQQGPHGRRMMRQTCTIQVNLDFGGTEEILAKRFLAANLVAPFATALFAHSPFLEGKETGLLSSRAQTWQKMDPTRTGFPELESIVKRLDRRACVDAYLDLVMNGKVVFAEKLGYQVMDGRLSFRDWVSQGVSGIKPTLKDFQTHLSLMFPEARARGFIELRSIDCQHRFWQDVPAAFYTGLLYDEKSLNELLDLLLPIRKDLKALWERSPYGLQDKALSRLAQKTMHIAASGFSRLPSCFQGDGATRLMSAYIERFTDRGLTPADIWLELARRQQNGLISVQDWEAEAQTWAAGLPSRA